MKESVALARESARRGGGASYRRPSCIHALATVLWVRFAHIGEAGDIDEAITLCEEGQALFKSGPFHSIISSVLSTCLQYRFTRFARMVDLDRAIALQRNILALGVREERPYRILQSNLANTY